ncbi:uncharacterized protein LOC129770043 [Toxorhynchites rutilus septentrionalis]|uniref:uncharacterized protein LOC129770043 n=1 Tax=Toxorhynchites rutilus septentrionalis TaxID=329112 RepID=UPI00247AB0D2|nr:uncharacterized protein LOC129770043 [Toxorhynchites rutilus septentrionalis]
MQSDSAGRRHLSQFSVSHRIDEMKQPIFVLVLVLACVNCIPLDSTTSSKPIDPDVISEEKPEDSLNFDSQKLHGTNVQKVPAKGAKLSVEVDKNESSTTTETSKTKRDTHSEEPLAKSGLKQNEGSSTTTRPESRRAPVVSKAKRSADEDELSTTNRPTSTRAPIPSSSNYDERDNTGPHFVRPVPVDQILKNIHEAPRHHLPSSVSSHHDDEESVVSTTVAEPSNNHKAHYKSSKKQPQSSDDEELEDHDETESEDLEDVKGNRR